MQQSLLYLSKQDVEKLGLDVRDVIDSVEEAFRQKGKSEMPPKPGIHPGKDSFIHAMPALIPELKAAGVKWVSGFPENPKSGLPYISGLLILNDPDTGIPISVMDCTWITAWRTAAATAVAAKYLARKKSETVGIIACGVQGRTNLVAINALFPLKRAVAFDIDKDTAAAYAKEMSSRLGIEVETTDSVRDAVSGLDIVVTSGPIYKDPNPVIDAGWLGEGAFACTLDFDSYWKGEAFDGADKLATDDIRQLDYYRTIGYFGSTPKPYADLGEIVTGIKPGREHADERIISINLGLAIEDMAVAVKLYEKARAERIGTELSL